MTIRHLLNGDETKETKSVVRFVWLKATDILLTSVYISQKKKKKKMDPANCLYLFFNQTPFPCRLLSNVEPSLLCCTVDPCWLSILNIVVYTLIESLCCKPVTNTSLLINYTPT